MATNQSTLPAPAWAGDRTRLAGTVYLGLAGLLNALTGVWLFVIAGSSWATEWLIDVFVGTFGELGGLYQGDVLGIVAMWVFPVVGVAVLAIAGLQVRSCWRAYNARGYRGAVGFSLLGSLNPVAFPPGLVAAILFVLSRDRFDGAGLDR